MWWRFEDDLRGEAKRRIREYERYLKRIHDENARRLRRSTGTPLLLDVQRPYSWSLDSGFNPFHVRSRASAISHAIERALRDGSYAPRRPAGFRVPKPSGGTRLVSTFPLADELISGRLYRALLAKNRPRLSARSYAYRPDLSVHDAILHIKSEFAQEQRLFVAEYDFSKFFDTISHDHVLDTIDRMNLVSTPLERQLLRAFLKSPEPYEDGTQKAEVAPPRTRGLPQGTSVSLFLANLAAAQLDRALERIGVGFVRYADDTLIWSSDYGAICEAANILHDAAAEIGSPINAEKSNGVRLLVSAGTQNVEMRSTREVEYLGHSIGLRSLRMKPAVVDKVKEHVNELLFASLLREPLKGTQNLLRVIGGRDADYVSYIWRLRRYLYGPLSEQQIRRFQRGQLAPLSFEGLMSFFPLVDDDDVLSELDRWIAAQTWLAVRKRAQLLGGSVILRPQVWGLTRDQLIGFQTTSTRTGATIDLRLPSLRRVAAVVRRGVMTYGLRVVGGGAGLYIYEM